MVMYEKSQLRVFEYMGHSLRRMMKYKKLDKELFFGDSTAVNIVYSFDEKAIHHVGFITTTTVDEERLEEMLLEEDEKFIEKVRIEYLEESEW